MKLLRYGPAGRERPAVVDRDGVIRDLSAHISDINGAMLSENVLEDLRNINTSKLPIVPGNVRIGPCVANVPKFICIGLNYSDHAEETGKPIPSEPLVFMKANSSICGPNDDVIRPRESEKLDWEVELGIVIGKQASYVDKGSAKDYIAGYCLVNDVSERAFQLEKEGQWCKGKSCNTFGPIGPWLVTKDEVPDVENLHIWLSVNGQRVQDGTTANMIFKPDFIVSYLSQFMTLMPGDIISTGTPAGVGMGQKPQKYLQDGDKMQLGIECLGEQNQVVVPFFNSAL